MDKTQHDYPGVLGLPAYLSSILFGDTMVPNIE